MSESGDQKKRYVPPAEPPPQAQRPSSQSSSSGSSLKLSQGRSASASTGPLRPSSKSTANLLNSRGAPNTPMPRAEEVEAEFKSYLSLLGSIPEPKRKAYSQLPLEQKWKLVVQAKQMRRETASVLYADEAIQTLMQPNRVTTQFLRRLKNTLAGFDTSGTEEEKSAELGRWLGEFIQGNGHIYLVAIWKNELKVIQSKEGMSELLGECCRCARELLNSTIGFQKMITDTNVVQYLSFSLRHINIKTQNLVLMALSALMLSVPEAHDWSIRFFADKTRVSTLRTFLKSKDPELCTATMLYINILINQCADSNKRIAVRGIFLRYVEIRKLLKKFHSKDFYESRELQSQVLVFEESADADARGDFAIAIPTAPVSLGQVSLASPRPEARVDPTVLAYKQGVVQQPEKATAATSSEVAALKEEINKLKQQVKSLSSDNTHLREAMKLNRSKSVFLGPQRGAVSAASVPAQADAADGSASAPPPPPNPEKPASSEETASAPQAPAGSVPPPPPMGPDGQPLPISGAPGARELPRAPGAVEEGGRALPPPPPSVAAIPAKAKKQPKKKMKPFLWTKIPPAGIPNTVWESIDDEPLFSKLNLDELESLFGVEAENKVADKAKPVETNKKSLIHLLPTKRGNAIQILLRGAKVNPADVRTLLTTLDVSPFSADQLDSIAATMPSAEEVTLIRAFTGEPDEVAPAERYLMDLLDIPLLSETCKALVSKQKFHSLLVDVQRDIKSLTEAVSQLSSSATLTDVLQLILALGNYLNGPSLRGGAYGFRLASLSKIIDVRSAKDSKEDKHTLLHYIADMKPKSLRPELNKVHLAARLNLSDVRVGFNLVSSHVEAMSKLLEDSLAPPVVHDVLSPFHDGAVIRLREVKDELQQLDTLYQAQLKRFGEPLVTPTTVFFEQLSNFVVSFEEALEDNANRIAKANAPPVEPKTLKIVKKEPSEKKGMLDSMISELSTANQFHRQITETARRKTLLLEGEDMTAYVALAAKSLKPVPQKEKTQEKVNETPSWASKPAQSEDSQKSPTSSPLYTITSTNSTTPKTKTTSSTSTSTSKTTDPVKSAAIADAVSRLSTLIPKPILAEGKSEWDDPDDDWDTPYPKTSAQPTAPEQTPSKVTEAKVEPIQATVPAPKKDEPASKPTTKPKQNDTCLICSEPLAENEQFCSFCFSPRDADINLFGSANTLTTNEPICDTCGEVLPATHIKNCPSCGVSRNVNLERTIDGFNFNELDDVSNFDFGLGTINPNIDELDFNFD